jgi:hypothetical protein
MVLPNEILLFQFVRVYRTQRHPIPILINYIFLD